MLLKPEKHRQRENVRAYVYKIGKYHVEKAQNKKKKKKKKGARDR